MTVLAHCAAQTIRDMLARYEARAKVEAVEHGTQLSYIIIDLSSCDLEPTTHMQYHDIFTLMVVARIAHRRSENSHINNLRGYVTHWRIPVRTSLLRSSSSCR